MLKHRSRHLSPGAAVASLRGSGNAAQIHNVLVVDAWLGLLMLCAANDCIVCVLIVIVIIQMQEISLGRLMRYS